MDEVRSTTDEVPEVLARALRDDADARAAWDAMPPSHRREYIGHITEAKKEETRARRVEASLERMKAWARERAR